MDGWRCRAMAWRYIALGFRTDCYKLLSAFQASTSHSFKRFTEIWREMKFSYIYYERKSFCELLEFTEEVFMVCKEFLYPPNSLPFQIGSIYLMYGLYLKQPTRNHVKIRFTLYEWELLNNVWNKTLSVNDFDVPLIISRLFLMNAFHFCFTERQMGLEKKFRKYYEGGEKSTGEMLPMSVTPLMEKLDVEAMEKVCEVFYQYEEARNNLNRLLLPYTKVELKKHFSADIIRDLNVSALERIEKESKEVNRYCELNGPTDSEDSNEERNEDAETGIPWWQCKKKMPWWKRCLPLGKQKGKNKKCAKETSMEDSSELSLEEDIDNPDSIYLSDKESINSEESTESQKIIIDFPSLPSEGNVSIADESHLPSLWNTRKRAKGKKQTKSALPSEGIMRSGSPSYSSCPVNKRRGIKRKKSTKAKTIKKDDSSVSSDDNLSVAITSTLSTPGNKRKTSKGINSFATKRSYKGHKSTKITVSIDNFSAASECDKSIAVTTRTSSPMGKRKMNTWKKSAERKNITTDHSLVSSEGNKSVTVRSSTSSPGKERKGIKRKMSTKEKTSMTDGSSVLSEDNMSVAITSILSSSKNKRETSKRINSFATRRNYKGKKSTKITVTVDNSSEASECDKSIAVTAYCSSPVAKRKTSKGKSTFAIGRNCKESNSSTTRGVTIDNSSVLQSVDGRYIAVPTHLTSPVNKRKKLKRKESTETINVITNGSSISEDNLSNLAPDLLSSQRKTKKFNKGKKSAKTKNIVINAMKYTSSEGKENVAVSNHPLSPGNKRKTNKGKKSTKASSVVTYSSTDSTDVSIGIPVSGLPSLPGKTLKSSKQKMSSKTRIVNTNNSSVCSGSDNSIAKPTHYSFPLHKRRQRVRTAMEHGKNHID